jgi:uncharacterized protein
MSSTPPTTRRHVLWGLAALAFLAGCASTPPRLYVLTPMPEEGDPDRRDDRSIGVQPVAMPEYLDRLEIVTYAGTHELEASRDDRWAERLPANVTRVVAENLSTLLGTDRVVVMPSRRTDRIDYEVAIDFDRFERNASGDGVLDAHWTILDGETQSVLFNDRSRFSARVPDDSYTSLTAVMSENLTMLSRKIATAIASLPAERRRPGS